MAAGKAAGVPSREGKKLLTDFTKTIDDFKRTTDKLAHALEHESAARPTSTRSTCATRSSRRWPRCASWATSSRRSVPSDLWPLPTYREMLFIK